jgi:hypothetical protein
MMVSGSSANADAITKLVPRRTREFAPQNGLWVLATLQFLSRITILQVADSAQAAESAETAEKRVTIR